MEDEIVIRTDAERLEEGVEKIKEALAAGRPIWLRTYLGAWGVRDIAINEDHAVKVKLGRQRNWTWLTYGQIDQLMHQVEEVA